MCTASSRETAFHTEKKKKEDKKERTGTCQYESLFALRTASRAQQKKKKGEGGGKEGNADGRGRLNLLETKLPPKARLEKDRKKKVRKEGGATSRSRRKCAEKGKERRKNDGSGNAHN